MANNKKFRLLKRVLYTIGLSKKSANEVVDWITNLLDSESTDEYSAHYTLPYSYSPPTNMMPDNVKTDTDKGIKLPYAKRDDFLTLAELNFYRVLIHTLNNRVVIFTKVSLSDIFYVKSRDRSEYQTYLNKIDRKHVDFLLCDVNTLQPICGVELDDKSHSRKDRQERDRFVDAVFEISDLPIVHIPVRQSYVTSDLYTYFEPYLDSDEVVPNKSDMSQPLPSSKLEPCCPKCGSKMILRTAKRGKNAGQQFWGCTNYPHCRAIIRLTESI